MDCSVIKDRLRLYQKEDISEKSLDLVKEHIENCSTCSELFTDACKLKEKQEDNYKAVVKKIKKSNKKRILMVASLVLLLCLFISNFAAAKINGEPLITIYSKETSIGKSSYTTRVSLGFVVHDYNIKYGKNYSVVKPWFSKANVGISLTTEQYNSLMKQLAAVERYVDPNNNENSYKREIFAHAKIFDIVEKKNEGDNSQVEIYAWLIKNEYIPFKGYIYEGYGESSPVRIDAEIRDDKITLRDIWYPGDGDEYAKSINKTFPSYVRNKIWDSVKDGLVLDLFQQLDIIASEIFGLPKSNNSITIEKGTVMITETIESVDENGEPHSETKVIYMGK